MTALSPFGYGLAATPRPLLFASTEILILSKIIPPGRNDNLLDNLLRGTQRFTAWIQTVSEGAQTLEGTGSPEGVVTAKLGVDYLDTAAAKFYKKSTSGGDTGWLILN